MSKIRGTWKQIGETGAWTTTTMGVVAGKKVVTLEQIGDLYATDTQSEKWQLVNNDKYTHTRFMFGTNEEVYTIDKDGTLYATNINNGNWRQIGDFAGYNNTIMGAVAGDKLVTIENSGIAYLIYPNGEWKKISDDNYRNTKFIFSGGKYFYTIENGTMYAVDPEDGSYRQVGETGSWLNTVKGVGMNDKIYTIENTGFLWETNGDTGEYSKLSEDTFLNTKLLFAGNNCLYTTEPTGCLYEIYV